MPKKGVSVKNSDEFPSSDYQSFSFQRVAYGGHDGIYYTSSVGKRTGGDGVFLMEMKEDDRVVGESLHTISKGIHDKGHSLTTKQSKDGIVDSLQTLHNLEEDELAGLKKTGKPMLRAIFLDGATTSICLRMQVLKIVHGTILVVGVAGLSNLSSIMEMVEPIQTLNPQSHLLVIPLEESSQ